MYIYKLVTAWKSLNFRIDKIPFSPDCARVSFN